ncbi:hypothetical protein PPL_01666 [Heterostelium album PN500]|uniref:Uncharacterized protein n=1 Tax=Heterostelium pallidum (strain ATCC 26659 / Pp 5 / PN500) TaxID=670386 RepID=D3B051_HETP5|nr:hypothetical protein PPL_01666 [Heterostelium album PN500]EFA84675.1 hypothetical protein PPL_01666 [Heterostelium album PN500]|eukprot:XP_020436788.1 hypothetical protein PPL_01666 [Heterostelium album PN500]
MSKRPYLAAGLKRSYCVRYSLFRYFRISRFALNPDLERGTVASRHGSKRFQDVDSLDDRTTVRNPSALPSSPCRWRKVRLENSDITWNLGDKEGFEYANRVNLAKFGTTYTVQSGNQEFKWGSSYGSQMDHSKLAFLPVGERNMYYSQKSCTGSIEMLPIGLDIGEGAQGAVFVNYRRSSGTLAANALHSFRDENTLKEFKAFNELTLEEKKAKYNGKENQRDITKTKKSRSPSGSQSSSPSSSPSGSRSRSPTQHHHTNNKRNVFLVIVEKVIAEKVLI